MADVNYGSHFLYPANLFCSARPYMINTILGSCVAVCLYDPVLQLGGMNHFMLPLWNGNGLASPKYGNIAIEKLIISMEMKGAVQNRMYAKVFGGGEVLDTASGSFKIGPRNIEVARRILSDSNISIKASHTGGKLGRKIQFNSFTSEVKMKLIEKVKIEIAK